VSDNILWVITDDQPRSTLGSMRKVWARLVRKGVRFTRAYSAMPLCGPARASILTSMYPHNHRCVTNNTHPRFVAQGLDRDTVATRIKRAGYDTGYFGKYMNALHLEPRYVAPGWDRWVVPVGIGGTVNVDGETRVLDTSREADLFAAVRLRRFVRRHRNSGPWFAVFAPTIPHDPYTPSAEHAHDFDDVRWDPPSLNESDMRDKPSWLRDLPPRRRADMRKTREGKLEELQDLDDQMNRLLGVLWRTGQLARTWIFFVSDNGFLLGEHRLFGKVHPYEESAGIPFVVRGPGVRPGARGALVSQVDLMPTTLDIAGLDPDAGRVLDGRSMLPHLRSGDWSGWRRRLLVENPDRDWAMVRERSIAYVEHYARGEWELYDLDDDPHQMSSRNDADVTEWSAKAHRLRLAQGTALRALEA
jgi:N-acetylglucosamine-6-sulfatase